MDAESDPSSASSERELAQNQADRGRSQQVVLEEARTAATQQISQINKLDDEAVRTARIALVLSGLLVGGAKFLSLPNFGLFGTFGTLSLVASLVTALFVYGTSTLFVGSGPDDLSIDYEEKANVTEAHVEVIGGYERGLLRNQRVLYSNAFFLGVSRFLLAIAAILFVAGLASNFVP